MAGFSHSTPITQLALQMRRRPTYALIDLDALRHNYRMLHELSGKRAIMAVVKANAYGHGLEDCARALVSEGVSYFGVGFLEEGMALRRAGIRKPILVLGGAVGYQAALFLEYDLELTVSSIALARKVAEEVRHNGHRAKVHLKIDTGMGRIGVNWQNALPFVEEALSLPELDVVGIYSHFATADEEDESYSREQLERFNGLIAELRAREHRLPKIHIANSGALFHQPDSHFDMVRLGISLYGCLPGKGKSAEIQLEPVLSLLSEAVFVKRVPAGTPVSYGCTWRAPRETTIVTVPIGYGDGYPRALSNRGWVLIRGVRMPVVGTVCMDQIMVDAGETRVEVGDPVVLIGRQGEEQISAQEVADWLRTIPYEVTTQISARVPRVFEG
ncbi:MAG: alanine racemase [bacterium]|nr:alanine racemase [bacterium]